MLRRVIVCLIGLFAGMSAADAQSPAPDRRDAVFACALQRARRPAVHAVVLQRVQRRARAFPRSTIPTARTCNSRSKACRRRTRPRNTASRTTISIRSATCLRRCGPAGRRRLPTSRAQGMQMSVRFSFKRSGEIIATPRVTYATAGVPADTRATYLKAINASLAGLHAAEIHRRAWRRARGAADRDPLRRQPRSRQSRRRSRDGGRVAHCAPSP